MKKLASRSLSILLSVFVIYQLGNLAYMNLRSADPILPGWEEFDEAKFDMRNARGEPMLVELYATWCPVCKAQHEAFEQLQAQGKAPNVRAVRVDFDRDQEFINKLGNVYTGTLLIYKDGKELVRASGLTSPEKIEAFLKAYNIDNQS